MAVVIPNHRRITELEAALASVASQTYPGEVYAYVVYQERPQIESLLLTIGPWVKAIPFTPDRSKASIAAQRNVGIEAAGEHLIAFLDDDDLWHPEKLRLQVAAMHSQNDAVGACTGYMKFTSDESFAWLKLSDGPVTKLSAYDVRRSGRFMTSSMIVESKVAKELLLDDRPEWLGLDDYDFKLRLADRGPILGLPQVLTALRADRTSTSRTQPTLQYARSLDVLVEWIKRGHRSFADWRALAVRCAVTAVFPVHRGEVEAEDLVDQALDGSLLGKVDRVLAWAIRSAWRSKRFVPAIRALVPRRLVQ